MLRFLLVILSLFFIVLSCSPDSTDTANDGDGGNTITKPTDLGVIADIVGTSTINPNGDGSGIVNFSIKATNATSYKVLINGTPIELIKNNFSHTFKEPGITENEVIVSAYNGPEVVSTTIMVKVFVAQEKGLVWSDEFNDGKLDLTKWSYETGTGIDGNWGTGQLDRATDRPENVSFQNDVPGAEGGCLVITTRSEKFMDRNYTSGRINTKDKGAWGPGHRIVARVHARDVKYQGQGFAFWMMPQEKPADRDFIMWPQGGEIDIMEYVGSIPYNNLATVHYAWEWQNNEYKDWNHGHLGGYYNYETRQVPDPPEPGYGNFPPPEGDLNAGSGGFHEYGLDWYQDRLEFFIDGEVYHIHYLNDGGAYSLDGEDRLGIKIVDGKRVMVSEYSNHFDEWHPFEHKMYAILSAGVGGADRTYGGPIVPAAQFPCKVFIDWVRVYAL